MMPRSTITPRMPQNSTRCWYSRGMAKKPKISAMTKMLSIASVFSTTKAGQVLSRRGGVHLPPDEAREGQAKRDVHGRHAQAFGHADLVIVLVQDAEVEGEKTDHETEKEQPHPQRLAHNEKKKEFHDAHLFE